MFKRVLIANRGEIALRVQRACRELDVDTVTVCSAADRESLPAQMAGRAVCIGPARAADSYLNQDAILTAALATGCDAVHPGYGFLSENAEFADACAAQGLTFIGPAGGVIRRMGNKAAARALMQSAGVPVVPGSDGPVDLDTARRVADDIGYPVLIKASAGGGGRGMRRVSAPEELEALYREAKAEAEACFGNGELYLEKLIVDPRHIEFQILADRQGHVIHLGERDCSIQRRNQKLVEESPSRALTPELRAAMGAAAVAAARAAGYENAGTVEFVLDHTGRFYFIEMNTRIQVEHPVTELVTGIDLVREQLRIAAGLPLSCTQEEVVLRGHAIECRINAEDPARNFQPCPGKVDFLHFPGGNGVRVDSHLYTGYELPPYYDSLCAKLIVHGGTRLEAIRKMRRALEELVIEGFPTNAMLAHQILYHPDFVRGSATTSFLERNGAELLSWSREETMSNVFARRRQKLLALRALRDGQSHPALDHALAAPCPSCGAVVEKRVLAKALYVCPQCGHHYPLGAYYRLRLVLDPGTFRELGEKVTAGDPLHFPGYPRKLEETAQRTGLSEAVVTAVGKLDGRRVAVGVLDCRFFMGSMSAAVGEKVTQLVEYAGRNKLPLILFSASGGARMQEGILSLMQMAKTSAALERFARKGGLYLSVLTDPTTGGVTASFASLGDIILAEPGALIGFAGPRVIEQTIRQTLPEGFQRAEFLQEHGFVDAVVPRSELRTVLSQLLRLHGKGGAAVMSETRTAQERVALARNPARPGIKEYLDALFTDFFPQQGDRCCGEDGSILGGIALFHGRPVTVLGHRKGRSLEENLKFRFGMPNPEGYRKARRILDQAEKFRRPVITFIDTPGAYPGLEAEERGQGEAIAQCLARMSALTVPVVCVVTGEGGSGGALALGVGNVVLMQENAVYSVLSPEGFASILWKDASRAGEACEVMKLTAADLLAYQVIDGIIPEPEGGAHTDPAAAAAAVDQALCAALDRLKKLNGPALAQHRYQKFRAMGNHLPGKGITT